MFIKGSTDSRPGLEAELKVWDKTEEYFCKRESFGFLHFPMFGIDHSLRREIDILIIDRVLGVTVIEVKGISSNQIENIMGSVWYCRKGDETFEISPYAQAERQMDMLCANLEKNPLLYRKFSKRAVVALPYITRKEWEKRGFADMLNSPPILFKDDMENGDWHKKLEKINIRKQIKPMNEIEWNAMKKHFSVDVQTLPFAENYPETKGLFSLTYFFDNEVSFNREEQLIHLALLEGKKVYIFSNTNLPKKFIEKHRDFIKAHQLQFFINLKTPLIQLANPVKDGKLKKETLKCIEKDFSDFNIGQYLAIHADIDENLKIMAGAGTGKTHVMIDRIMYLIEREGVEPRDIVMITFTNSSTAEMKSRFQKRMLLMFSLTNKKRYLEFAENIKNMKISTIHSYSKSILTDLAHEIGFGRGVKIRSFIKAKDDIIERLTNEYFENHPVGGIERVIETQLDHHVIAKLMRTYWDEMERKGLTREEIETLDWGGVSDLKFKVLHEVFQFVFSRCEKVLEDLKRRENSIDIGDMIRKLRWFSSNNKMNQLDANKFLFVDEFQDSDNTQIELVASLHEQLGYKTFVVGDVKQSIYRFRGADYTSFERLESKMGSISREIYLNQNYRTTSSLLDKLDPIFSYWGETGGKLLPYGESDRLIGMEKTIPSDGEFLDISIQKYQKLDEIMIDQILDALESVKELSADENRRVAVLVRTNGQALQIAKICENAGIPVSQNLEGMFYRSDAVIHFKMLLDALLHPKEAKYLVNLLESPYFSYSIPIRLLIHFDGNSERIVDYIHSKIGDDFTRYLEEMRHLPLMAVIQKIITEKGLLRNLESYYERMLGDREVAKKRAKHYELDLAHLMNLIHQHFDAGSNTLWVLNQWISLQIKVNRNENSPMDEAEIGDVEITTVHRAKGLEYHTVLLPKLNFPFKEKRNMFYVEEEKSKVSEERSAGWRIDEKGINAQSEYYSVLDALEEKEITREETRLLYVALTRAKKKIILIHGEPKPDTWGDLLDKAMGGIQNVR